MKSILITFVLGTNFLGSLSQARSCRDEPERCPVRVMSCSHHSAMKILTASVYSSLFSGYSVQVFESICIDRNCRQQKVNGNFRVSGANGGYVLVNQSTGATYSLLCTKTANGDGL
jgi:hypothetical protein